MKLFLDDERQCPEGWTLARDDIEFDHYILTNYYDITHISFDHDLGDCSLNGSRITTSVLAMIDCNLLALPNLVSITCHSSNPEGKANIISKWNSAKKVGLISENVFVGGAYYEY